MLYLVRHGSTDQRVLRSPGDLTPATREEWLLDHGLSEHGRSEAQLLRERLRRTVPADVYLSSPRRRTQETAAIALPNVALSIDERLHEWHVDEALPELLARCRWLLQRADQEVLVAFTHGGFIRAVVAAVLVGEDVSRFEATFHDLRRMLHIWNASLTIIGHGASGLEVMGVNLCHPIEAIAGRE